MNRAVLGLLFGLVFFFIRAPFFSQPMVREEGLFADLYLHSPMGPDYGLMARVKGKAVRAPLDHPGPLYLSMTGLGKMARVLGWMPVSGSAVDSEVRFLNTCFQFFFWILLIFSLPFSSLHKGHPTTWVLFVFLISPIAVGSSLYPQTDNTVGFLCCGLLALAVQRGPVWTWVLAALLLGFSGKQEWNICVALALGMAGLWGLASGRKKWFFPLGWILLGTLAGSFLSWLYDPVNWIGGIQVMMRVSTANNVVARPGGIGHWALNLLLLFPFLVWLGLGLIFLGWRVWTQDWKKADLPAALGLALPLALTGPFLMSTWGREYRYFAPAFAAVVVGVLFDLSKDGKEYPIGIEKWTMGLGIFALVYLMGAWILGRSITEAPPLSLRKAQAAQEEELQRADEKGCLPVLSTGFTYAREGMDFVDESLSRTDQEKIAAQAGLKLCP